MARAFTAAAMLLTITAHTGFASDDDQPIGAEITSAADDAGVDPVDLAGAVNTTGLDAKTYLCRAEGMGCPKPAVVATAGAGTGPPVSSMWYALAQCESSGIWSRNSGNGYYGGLQEDMSFWRRYGGTAFAARPDQATPLQQITVAIHGLAVQGPAAWPVCSRVVGLR